jgi:pimeloyl-ACP methyl ester carboxylesterase
VHRPAMRGGHWIQLDEPELVVDAVRELIATANERV